jgi:high-affinity iron transporter
VASRSANPVVLSQSPLSRALYVAFSSGPSYTNLPVEAVSSNSSYTVYLEILILFSTALTIFLIIMANLLLVIGAGLFSKAVANFETRAFFLLLGASSDDAAGTGPGSYDVRGNVWHLDCCSTEQGSGWGLFGSIVGWSNNGSGTRLSSCFSSGILFTISLVGTVLAYVFYWVAVIVTLVIMKFKEVN